MPRKIREEASPKVRTFTPEEIVELRNRARRAGYDMDSPVDPDFVQKVLDAVESPPAWEFLCPPEMTDEEFLIQLRRASRHG